MNIGIKDLDCTNFPNLALMKISAYHKSKADMVEFYDSKKTYSRIYASKVFTYTKQNELDGNVFYGGTGHDLKKKLPLKIDRMCPDYDLYGLDYSLGFLTRGCIRKCKHCLVPEKEGFIKPYMDIEEFLRHDKAVLMDNNILACNYGIKQIEKIIKLGIKVDFNQGLDARLIDKGIAKLLSKVKWLKPIRLACDNTESMKYIQRAVTELRWQNTTPNLYFVYVLVNDVQDAIERIKFLKGLYLDPFAQPYRDIIGTEPTDKQKDLARWVNAKQAFRGTTWENYKGRAKKQKGE